MTLRVDTVEEYERALRRMNQLRDLGATVEGNAELAELETATSAYTAQHGGTDERKGRPPR